MREVSYENMKALEEENKILMVCLADLRKSIELTNYYATFTINRGKWLAAINEALK